MTVRLLRKKQRGPRCSYCDLRADYRGLGFTKFACAAHEAKLRTEDQAAWARENDPSDAEWMLGI